MPASRAPVNTAARSREEIALLRHFARLDEPRQSAKVLYPLPEIVLLVVCATIADCDDNVEICAWGRHHLGFLRRFLPFADGIPSHDTLGDVLNAIDPDLFEQCFIDWIGEIRDEAPDIVAIDGKTSRRTHDRPKGRKALHVVSAWASRQRLVLGQQATEEKSNEITAIPLLLDRLMLKGSVVTIDAMGCQVEIAGKIIDKGADYCLALKENRPALYGEVERLFADPEAEGVTSFKTVDKDHGRLEVRRHSVCAGIGWLASDRRHPGELKFPGLKMIGMVESETEREGGTAIERRYYLCSKVMTAQEFAGVVRAHWGVENRLHWRLDVIFNEDQCRMRSGHGPQNMAVFRHIAINLMRTTQTKSSLKVRRKEAAWNPDYLEDILRGCG
ncbi:MAG: ISAs1 family transposase [Geminicoccaceae bacterium]